MHLRPEHAVTDLPTLHAFIRAHPLGLLTTSLPSENFPTLQCSHIPWVLDADASIQTASESNESSESLNGTPTHTPAPRAVLRGHIARANPQTAAMLEAVTDSSPAGLNHQSQSRSAAPLDQGHSAGSYLPGEVLVVFTSPVDHYITPHFYTAAKAAASAGAGVTTADGVGTGKARIAPTWNYAAVQVYGRMRVFHEPGVEETGSFLHRQLSDLARLGEEGVMEFMSGAGGTSTSPWTIEDAPEKYIAALKKGIIGMEVEITRVEGRFKVSQERPVGDRAGVVDGLEGRGGAVARRMAEFVRDGRVV